VLDPDKVPDAMPVYVNGVYQGGRMRDMSLFVQRDVRRAFASYFEHVSVVSPAQLPRSGTGLIVDVLLDRLSTVSQTIETESTVEVRGRVALNWSVALRPMNASDYLWAFTASSHGEATSDPQLGYRTLLEHAITDMLKDYAQQHVQERLQAQGSRDVIRHFTVTLANARAADSHASSSETHVICAPSFAATQTLLTGHSPSDEPPAKKSYAPQRQ